MGCEAKSLDRVSQHRARSSAADTPVHLSSSLHRVLRLQQSVGNRAVQRLIQRPDLQDRLSLNVTGYSPNASRLALRAAEESSDTPTEEQKRAALAAAARAERVASQAAAVGKAEIDKSNQNQTKENRLKQAGKQRAEASSSAAEQAKRKGKKKTKAAGRSGRRRAPGRSTAAPAASRSGRAPSSPAEDPGFQKVVKRVGGAARQQRSHKTPEEKAAEAQAAAVAPGEEITGRAQGNKAAEIEHAPAPPFNAAAFKEQLLKRIADLAPKTLSEADNFKSDDRLGSVKDDMQGKVAAEKTASKEPLEKKASESPDPSTVEPKPVTPIPPPAPGAPPPAVGAADAAPKPKTKQEIEQPIRENTAGIGDELAKENITEEQLAKSNEPTFQSALSAKKQAEAHAATAPGQYRKAEQATVSGAARQAVAVAGAGTRTMHAARTDAFGKVHGVQRQSKSKDEAARLKVGQDIDRIYQETSADVGKILTELDGKVESAFDEGASAAKQVFEDYVDAQMEAYKERRYGGWFGWARWAKDKLLGMPDEVNVFYERGRNLYIRKMDAVIDNVVAIIGKELTAARARVAEGRRKITEYLANLPEDLKKVGGEAAENALTMFDSLEEQVNSKQESLIDTLANKYQENLKAIDARIEELKAANRGLVAKAIDAVKAVVNAIIEIKNFLKTVLSKIANVISLILDDPIGFLGNLISALKQGFTNFAENIWDHIKGGFISWLTGAMGSVRLVMPEDIFSVKGMFSILLQVLGIGWDYIRAKAVKLLGAPAVRVLEGTFTVFQILMKEGPAGLWEFAKEKFTDLKNALVDQIQDMVITQVIKAGIKWLIGLLNPVSAFIKAAMAIYEIVKFFIEKARQIGEFISALIDAVADVARGSIGGAAKKVEDALIRAIPLIIGFLASLLGLSGLAGKVQKLFTTLRSRVDAFIDGLILKARQFVKKAVKTAGAAARGAVARVTEWWRTRKSFRAKDGQHSLYFTGRGAAAVLTVASGAPSPVKTFLEQIRTTATRSPDPALRISWQRADALRQRIERFRRQAESRSNANPDKLDELNSAMGELAQAVRPLLDVGSPPTPGAIRPVRDPKAIADETRRLASAELKKPMERAEAINILTGIERRLQPAGLRRIDVAPERNGESIVYAEINPRLPLFKLVNIRRDIPSGRTVMLVARLTLWRSVQQRTEELPAVDPSATVGRGGFASRPGLGGIVNPRVSSGFLKQVDSVTWNTSDMNASGNKSHAERQFAEWLLRPGNAGLRGSISEIDVQLKSYSPCGACADNLAAVLKQIRKDREARRRNPRVAAAMPAEVTANLRWLSWYPGNQAGSPGTTWTDLHGLEEAGWRLHAPGTAMPPHTENIHRELVHVYLMY